MIKSSINKYRKRKKTIFGQFFIHVTIIVVFALLVLGTINYQYSRKILVGSINEKNQIIQSKIIDLLSLQDASLEIIEDALDKRAKHFSLITLEYLKGAKDIEKIDLKLLQKEIGLNSKNEDIYIINRNGIVVNTTFDKDLGLNFFNFGEEHKNYLINVFNERVFVPERFAIESSTKRLKKYTYQPTSDGKFILELGIYSKKADEIAGFVKEMLNKLSENNENILSVDLFIGEDAPFSLNKPNIELDKNTIKTIKGVFNKKNNFNEQSIYEGKSAHFEYIYVNRKNTDLYKSSVIRIITDRSDEELALMNLFMYSSIIFGITLLVVVYSIYRKAKSIAKPIENLGAKVKRITKGNYNERAAVEGDNEISEFSIYFNKMLDEIESSYNKLEKARSKAEESDRLKSAFLANMSHEIRTPMNAVIGFTEILDQQIEDKSHKEYLNSIKNSGKNLLSIINDILDISKIEAGKLELAYSNFNPEDIFNEMKQIFDLQSQEKGLNFKIDIKQSMPEVYLDEVRFRQILINLIGNAFKFTHNGYVKLSASYIFSNNSDTKCDLKINIEDTGVGIDEASQKMIFEPFKQKEDQDTKKYGGTGLGLSITRKLTEMMNGEISVESQLNKGSIFSVVFKDLNFNFKTKANSSDEILLDDKLSFKNQLVLVVDDVEVNRKLIIEYLKVKKLEFVEAADGEECIEKTLKNKPALILLDIRMPKMNGIEAIKKLKKNKDISSIPVIAVTASVMKEERERLMEVGFDGFLQKPIRSKELFRQITRFLDFSMEEIKENEEEEVDLLNDEEINEISLKAKGILKDELYPQWKVAYENQMITDIQAFAEKSKVLGEEYSIGSIKKFGEVLLEYTESFDIDKMNNSMNNFPDILKNLKVEL